MAAETRFDPLTVSISKPLRRRWMRRIALAFIFLFMAATTVYGVWRYRASEARNAAIAKIQAAGEPVWFADLRPEPLDPKEDATPLLLKAFDAMSPLPDDLVEQMRELREPPDVDEDAEDPAFDFQADEMKEEGDGESLPDEPSPDDMPPEEGRTERGEAENVLPPVKLLLRTFKFREARLVEELRPHVEANREFYASLEQALDKGRFQFAIDYDDPLPFLREYPERDTFAESTKLLDARWRCQLHDGDVVAAGKSCEQMLHFCTKMVGPTSTLITLLLNVYRTNAALEAVSETVARGGFESSFADRIDQRILQLESSIRLRPAYIGERAEIMTLLENMLEHGAEGEPLVKSQMLQSIARPWIWSNQAWYLKYMEPRVAYADRYDAEAMRAIRDIESQQEADSANNFTKPIWFAQMMLPAVDFNIHVQETRDRLRAVPVGLRVDAFRRQHGRLPKVLDEIKGQDFPEIPSDLAGERPLAYIVDKDAFAICPASDVERETRRLAKRVKQRDADPEKTRPEAADEINGFFSEPQEERDEDDDARTAAFQVVYPRATSAMADDGGKDR